MIQMTFNTLSPPETTRPTERLTPKAPVTALIKPGWNCDHTGLVDVSETAQDAGIPYKVAVTTELYDRVQGCHPGDPYENEVVLWNVLWLAEFERTLNVQVPVFAFTAAIPCANGENEDIRLRYVAGDPAAIEIAQ